APCSFANLGNTGIGPVVCALSMRAKLLALVPIAVALGCAHVTPPPPALDKAVIHGDAITVTAGSSIDQLLASMNAEELFTKGSSAYAAGDHEVAAKAFDRLCEVFPKSEHFAAASYNAGLAHEQLASKAEG